MKTTEGNISSVCVVCGEPEAQWSCQRKGCNSMYHLSCVRKHQPDDFITVGGWCCVDCIKKKLQFGAAFACDEIESIWDVKRGKAETKYWVKYMNLAHVHNCWIPESRICQKTPELLAKFVQEYQTNKGTTWKKEWAKPERLLLCRNLMHVGMAQKFFQGLSGQLQYCNTEWLVKWKGLGYEHATWELGSLKFLRSSEVKRLIQEYNRRQDDAARRAEFASRHNMIEKDPFVRLEAFPSEFPHGLEYSLLESLKRLRQFWHKSRNAVLIDQERVTRIVLFIKSIIDHIAQPFLILSMKKSLPLWEDKIRQLIPSVHVVVHTNRSTNSIVEVTEFWGQDGQLLFQVFLSSPDAIQGFEAIKQISWECVIVDQCDSMNTSTHLEQIKTLSTDFKMLILNKDDPSLYVKLLSVLEPGDTFFVSNDSILKERFSRYIAYQTGTDPPNCEIVPFTGEKGWPLLPVSDNRDCYQYLSSIVNPRKRKESPNDVVDLFVLHGVMIEKSRAVLEKPTSTDLPASSDTPVSEKINQIFGAKRSKSSNCMFALRDGTRIIHLLLKPRAFRLHEMLGIPENVNSVANIFLNHVLERHRARVAPFIILKHYLRGILEVILGYGTSLLSMRCEDFIHWLEMAKRFCTQHIPRLGYYDPPITISPSANQKQVVPQKSKSLERKIKKICSRRENKLHVMHRRELLELELHEKKEARCYLISHMSVLKNRHTVAKSDKNTQMLLKKTIEKFKAFQKHIACQRRMLELLQEKARAAEKSRKEEWFNMVKLGALEESFDFNRIPLPDSGFVCEKFDWVCGESVMNYGGSSRENVLEKLDCGPSTVGHTSVETGASANKGGSPNGVQHDVPVGRQSTMHSVNASSYKGSDPAIFNCTTQKEIEGSTIYTGASAASHNVRTSQQLSTNTTSFMAEDIPVNVEELLCCAEMLIEPVERETNISLPRAQASMPDIGVSALSGPDVGLQSSNDFLDMPSFTQEMFPNGPNLDPLVNELTRIRDHRIRNLTKIHEEKKLKLQSQREAEMQNTKRKYDALNKETDATLMKNKKFLQHLTCKVEDGETMERELRAFEIAAESDIPLQDWNEPSAEQNSSSQLACGSELASINCASSGLGPSVLSCQNTRAQPTEIRETPCVQTNLASPITTNKAPPVPSSPSFAPPLSTSPEFQISTNEAPTMSASLGATASPTIHVPHLSSNHTSAVPANLTSTPVTTFHTGDDPARLRPYIPHIRNKPTQYVSTLHPYYYHHMLNPDTLGMSPSTSCASSVQKTSTPAFTIPPASPVQVPHVQFNLTSPIWTNQPRPTSTSQVLPAVASMSYLLPNMVAPRPPTTSSGQETHPHTGRSQSVMGNPIQPVSTNWAPPVHIASLPHPPPGSQYAFNCPYPRPGSQYAFNYPYMLRAPSPHMRHLRPHLSTRPQAPQATISDHFYNVSNFGGSIWDPNQRSGHKAHFQTDARSNR